MAKVKTIVTLETIQTSIDQTNWMNGTDHHFETGTVLQENGVEAIVTCPAIPAGTQFTLSEVEALYTSMKGTERTIE